MSLFCRHNYVVIKEGPQYHTDSWGFVNKLWYYDQRCTKCGKIITKVV